MAVQRASAANMAEAPGRNVQEALEAIFTKIEQGHLESRKMHLEVLQAIGSRQIVSRRSEAWTPQPGRRSAPTLGTEENFSLHPLGPLGPAPSMQGNAKCHTAGTHRFLLLVSVLLKNLVPEEKPPVCWRGKPSNLRGADARADAYSPRQPHTEAELTPRADLRETRVWEHAKHGQTVTSADPQHGLGSLCRRLKQQTLDGLPTLPRPGCLRSHSFPARMHVLASGCRLCQRAESGFYGCLHSSGHCIGNLVGSSLAVLTLRDCSGTAAASDGRL